MDSSPAGFGGAKGSPPTISRVTCWTKSRLFFANEVQQNSSVVTTFKVNMVAGQVVGERQISPFNFRSTGFCAAIFKDHG